MKQTPIQQAIEQIEAEMKIWESQSPSPVRGALLRSRQILQSLLPYERECIEGAYKEGAEDVEIKNNKLHYFISAQDYFTSTYTQ